MTNLINNVLKKIYDMEEEIEMLMINMCYSKNRNLFKGKNVEDY